MRLRALAPAKVNLALFVGAGRRDGRHRLVTLFESLSLADVLELQTLEPGARDEVICPSVQGENLAARALALLREHGWDGPPVRVTIDKRVPVAGGMAGGSADAAATLRLAMALAPGRAHEVGAIAAALGADVPAQLLPGLSIGTGAGELVERLQPLGTHVHLVLPAAVALSTPAVFAEADRLARPRTDANLGSLHRELVDAVAGRGRLPAALIANDLEAAAVSLYPPCGEALAALREAGAEQALVSGSGPTVVGIWWGEDARALAAAAREALRPRWPEAVVAVPVAGELAAATLI
ncbi:MAG: 4-(cytidine 5'-diphospho)-2-C-methyl-D-erythritol kinase [Solirubrobacteraceae bacterium]